MQHHCKNLTIVLRGFLRHRYETSRVCNPGPSSTVHRPLMPAGPRLSSEWHPPGTAKGWPDMSLLILCQRQVKSRDSHLQHLGFAIRAVLGTPPRQPRETFPLQTVSQFLLEVRNSATVCPSGSDSTDSM